MGPLEYRQQVAAQLRAELAASGLAVTGLEALTGLPRATVYRYLRGERDVPVGVFMHIAAALGTRPGLILERAVERASVQP